MNWIIETKIQHFEMADGFLLRAYQLWKDARQPNPNIIAHSIGSIFNNKNTFFSLAYKMHAVQFYTMLCIICLCIIYMCIGRLSMNWKRHLMIPFENKTMKHWTHECKLLLIGFDNLFDFTESTTIENRLNIARHCRKK